MQSFERYRQEYYDHLLAVSQRGDWEAWLRFFLRGVSSQAQDSLVRMQRLEAIRTKYEPLVKSDRYYARGLRSGKRIKDRWTFKIDSVG